MLQGTTLWFMQCTNHNSLSDTWYFFDLLHDCMEIYMDEFTVVGDTFDEYLTNLEKVQKRCRETNIALRNEKWFMIMIEGIILSHYLSTTGIKVDPTKIEVIFKMLPPTN